MKPNVIIVTFDCLRPDRLRFAGYRGVDTPTFDRLAEESLVCENAYCQAPNTWISHASMFTGCLPARHGVRTPLRKLSAGVPTLAETLKAAGYVTLGLPAMSLLSREAGFDRGFDRYDLSGLAQHHDQVVEHRTFRTTHATLERVRAMLGPITEPFLLWIHHFAIHRLEPAHLELPAEFRASYSEYAQHYDAKVSYADDQFLRPLLELLQTRGIRDRTALVLWSDHGENLHDVEHREGRGGHNWGVEEDVLRTLLMVCPPGQAGPRRLSGLTASLDILPTVCELCEIQVPEGVQGRSLLGGEADSAERAVYFENLCQGFMGVRRGEWKLVLSVADEDGTDGPQQAKVPLRQKLAWRWRLVRDTARAILRRTSVNKRRRTSERRGPGLKRWWRTKQPPEQVATDLLRSGTRELYRLRVSACEPADNAAETEQLLDLLKTMALEGTDGGAGELSNAEKDAMEKRLSELGYC